jgi:hypothetical protein
MTIKKITLIVTSLQMMAFSAIQANEVAHSVDAKKFDVAGVKLGMSPKEAESAIIKKMGINKKSIKYDRFPQKNLITNTKEPQYFNVKSNNSDITVYFSPMVPYNKETPMVVSRVLYEIPWSQENVETMKTSTLAKYGQTSNGSIGSYAWCLKPHKNVGMGCFDFQGPKLGLSGTKLDLSDPSYQQAVIKFMNNKRKTKPSF